MLEFQRKGDSMEDFLSVLSRCALFQGVAPEEIQTILPCLGSKTRSVSKGGPVFLEGEPARWEGGLLPGTAHRVHDG